MMLYTDFCAAVTLTDDAAEGADAVSFRRNKLHVLFDHPLPHRWIDRMSDAEVDFFYNMWTNGKGERIKSAFRMEVEWIRMKGGLWNPEGMSFFFDDFNWITVILSKSL